MTNSRTRLRIGVPVQAGFFKGTGAKRLSTIASAVAALAEVSDGAVEIVYLTPEQPRVQSLHGLLLPGGNDVDPGHYGRPDLRDQVQEADYQQDASELDLARWAITTWHAGRSDSTFLFWGSAAESRSSTSARVERWFLNSRGPKSISATARKRTPTSARNRCTV